MITHGGALSTLYRHVMGRQIPRVPTNASLHRLIYDHTTKRMHFATWNETEHLKAGCFSVDAFEGKYD